jgi:TetR/AcrR family acrAB operon transcriptional repressor
MPRRTKEEALVTRRRILDAAESLFEAQGVSGTSLHAIAMAAGVTRGAIYWHFKDKSAVFNAMIDRVRLPMEQSTALLGMQGDTRPLTTLRAQLLGILTSMAGDEQAQRVVEIVTHKVEYVGDLVAVRERRLQIRRDFLALLERTLRSGQRRGEIVRVPSAKKMAIGLHALLDGLIRNWMLDPSAFDLLAVGRGAFDAHLAGLAAH